MIHKPSVAIFKFASCDGCQLTLLDMEDDLLAVGSAVDLAFFPEASSAMEDGPYDLTLVEGSVTSPDEVQKIKDIRFQSKYLAVIGACGTAGGIQALKNFANVEDYIKMVYAKPELISTLETSRPISDYVSVDFELFGCPISKDRLREFLGQVLGGQLPRSVDSSLCMDCKLKGIDCRMVSHGEPCLGPVTRADCGGLCMSYNRSCFGCYGPRKDANIPALRAQFEALNIPPDQVERLFKGFTALAFDRLEHS